MLSPLLARSLRQPATRLSFAVMAVVGAALCFVPLFSTVGIEHALVVALVSSPLAAAAGARLARSSIRDRLATTGGTLAGASLCTSLLLVAIPLSFGVANAVRVPWCEPGRGLALFALVPGFGVVLAGLVGAGLGSVWPGRASTWASAGIPLACVGWSLGRFYVTPDIFLFDPFTGWFPGTLYDQVIPLSWELLTYRALTLAAVGAVAVTLAGGLAPGDRWRPGRLVRRRWALVAAALAWSSVVLGYLYGPELGHRESSDDIASALGSTLHGRRCDVVVPKELDRREARRLRDDCDFRYEQMERRLGARGPERVRAFFFRDATEKRRLMGAAETYIAKPWRHEVYLQLSAVPHPALAHELAHVVAGSFGSGPFRIAGLAGGLWPLPGLIEGVAVAAAWEPRDGLTPHQWARAMTEAGLAPRPAAIVGAAFLGAPAGRAYAVSGSFVRWLLDTRGAPALHRLYSTGSFQAAYGQPASSLERGWRAFLVTVPLGRHDVELARARFSAPAIWDEPCAHHLAELREDAATRLGSRDAIGAARVCREVLRTAPYDSATRVQTVRALALAGHVAEAQRELARLRGRRDAPRSFVAAADEAMADALWLRGHDEQAADLYAALLAEPRTEPELRMLEVKRIGAASGIHGWALRQFLLAGVGGEDDPAVGVYLLGRLEEVRTDGLAAYLAARQLAARGDADLAVQELDRALGRGLPTARLRTEAERMLPTLLVLDAAERHGLDEARLARAERLLRANASNDAWPAALRDEARDWLERSRWVRAHPRP